MPRKKEIDHKQFENLFFEQNLTREEVAEILNCSTGPIDTLIREYRNKGIEKPIKQQREAVKRRNLARTGKANGFTKESEEKRKKTNLERYGCEYCSQNPEVQTKRVETWKKNNSSSPEALKNLRNKVEQTCLEKYGVKSYMATEECKQRRAKTCLEKYGVKYAAQSEEVKAKTIETNLKKYGVKAAAQHHLSPETLFLINDAEAMKKFILENNLTNARLLSERLNYSLSKLLKALHRLGCFELMDGTSSYAEKEVGDFLIQLGIKYEKTRSLISPYELDFYCPDYQIAIEYNGDYWHRSEKLGKRYHLLKSQKCAQKGVFLYHIFEYEWENPSKQEKIKNQLKNLFGKNEEKFYARKCNIKEVSSFEKNVFLEKNHLQGADRSEVKLGLYYKEELVSLMTFCRPRFSKTYDWELSRFCSKANSNVVGGAQKLFDYFISFHKGETIVSYSNIAKTKGTLYEKLNFKLDHISEPNYVWSDLKTNILTRYQTQMIDEDKIMEEKGYVKIYDCGNKVWVFNN